MRWPHLTEPAFFIEIQHNLTASEPSYDRAFLQASEISVEPPAD
jgi:hypothetical protein